MDINNQKPCSIQTAQGFSVSYKGFFLYSKYNPAKLIEQKVESLDILPGTIFLCNSPALSYGLESLYKKLPENCLMILCEADYSLFDFESEWKEKVLEGEQNGEDLQDLQDSIEKQDGEDLQDLIGEQKSIDIRGAKWYHKILQIPPTDLPLLPLKLYDLTTTGRYRRVVRIDFSAGVQFHKNFYDYLEKACIYSIGTFWKNRVTLVKFGRKYCRNLFINLGNLPATKPISNFFRSVEKPILVFGAGVSLDLFFERCHTPSFNPKDFCIIAADTAMQSLLARSIKPDFVFLEEAQNVITKAFIGDTDGIQLCASLSSNPNVAGFFEPQKLSYFTTEFTKAKFLDRIKDSGILPPSNPPFGSVGLTALCYALKFRKGEEVPIYVCGLDFSFPAGQTHARGTLAQNSRLASANRIRPIASYASAYSPANKKVSSKDGKNFWTSPVMESYAATFDNLFGQEKNLFDAGLCGLQLDIPKIKPEEIFKTAKGDTTPSLSGEATANTAISNTRETATSPSLSHKASTINLDSTKISNFLESEKAALKELKDLLTGKIKLPEEEQKAKITALAEEREYLYLHFPDGYQFCYNQSFLNRIRTEIDFYLKIL